MTLAWIILTLTILITPLVFCPLFLFDGYILPQITVMCFGTIIALLIFMLHGMFLYNWIVVLVLCLLLFYIVSTVWSTCVSNTQKEIPLVFGYLVTFILLFNLFVQSDVSIKFVFVSASVATVLSSVYGYIQSKGIDPLFPERVQSKKDEFKDIPIEEVAEFYRNNKVVDIRAISTLGNTNFAAGFFISGLPFVLALSILVHWSFIILSVPVVIGIFIAKSRAGLLSLFVSFYFFILLEAKQGWAVSFIKNANELQLFVLQLIIGLFMLFVFYRYFYKIKNIIKVLSEDNPINNKLDIENTHKDHPVAHLRYRFRYWKAAVWLIKKKPLLGYGLRTYRKEVYRAQAELDKKSGGKFLGPNYQTPQPRECHNDIIENFVEGGIVGGGLFLLIVGTIFWHGICYFWVSSGSDALLMLFMLSGIMGMLVNASFFFPLRLASSSLYFWTLLAAIESLCTKQNVSYSLFAYNINPIVVAILGVVLLFCLYECIIKQNIANYYFNRFNFSKNPEKKEQHLNNAVKWSPKDSIFHTHMLISYMAGFPRIADREAQILFEHYDGMTPAWSMAYNCGITAMLNKGFLKAVELFALSLYYYPSFEPARAQIQKVWPLAPLPSRGVRMKVIDKNVKAFIDQCSNSSNNPNISKEHNKILELSVIASILDEKVRLNIPSSWPFWIERGMFLAPNEITGDHEMYEVGHIKLLLVKGKN